MLLSILEVTSSYTGLTRKHCQWMLTNGLLVALDLRLSEISFTVIRSFTQREIISFSFRFTVRLVIKSLEPD
jgi:hypothetical protein